MVLITGPIIDRAIDATGWSPAAKVTATPEWPLSRFRIAGGRRCRHRRSRFPASGYGCTAMLRLRAVRPAVGRRWYLSDMSAKSGPDISESPM